MGWWQSWREKSLRFTCQSPCFELFELSFASSQPSALSHQVLAFPCCPVEALAVQQLKDQSLTTGPASLFVLKVSVLHGCVCSARLL